MDHGIVDTSPDFVGDALHLPLRDRSVDIVFATQVIEHVSKPHVVVRECSRVLRPNGFLILSGPFFGPSMKNLMISSASRNTDSRSYYGARDSWSGRSLRMEGIGPS